VREKYEGEGVHLHSQNTHLRTQFSCAEKVSKQAPVAASHRRTVRSRDPDAKYPLDASETDAVAGSLESLISP